MTCNPRETLCPPPVGPSIESTVVVDMGQYGVSGNPDARLATYALGSCIAVVLHDGAASVGGILHLMLPDSRSHAAKAESNPFMFADTGIPLFLQRMTEAGAMKRRLTVRLAGGAQLAAALGSFDIGKQNYVATRKILWKLGLMIHKEAVGGTSPRSVRLEVRSGKVWLRESGGESEFPARTRASEGA